MKKARYRYAPGCRIGQGEVIFRRRDLRLALLFLLLPSFIGNIKASTDPFVFTVTMLINLWRKKGGRYAVKAHWQIQLCDASRRSLNPTLHSELKATGWRSLSFISVALSTLPASERVQAISELADRTLPG